MRYLGVEQDVLLNEERRFFVVVESQADFLIPANVNDELLVTVDLLRVSRASFLIAQEIYRKNSASELLCRGTTRAAFLNADTYKPVKVPAAMFEDPEK